MITFDQVLPKVHEILKPHSDTINRIQPVIVNRDLNGRVRLIIRESVKGDSAAMAVIKTIADELAEQLKPHSFLAGQLILFDGDFFEQDIESLLSAPTFSLGNIEGVYVMDRLANESRWASIAPLSSGVPRAVFFSIKEADSRSVSMCVLAWSLAQAGKRVLVIGLNLELPGLHSALLPAERQPAYGITDWLIEDLVDNGDAVFEDMIATSALSHDGEIYVVPAHGREPREYISKLGRICMPKIDSNGRRESWSQRLRRLLDKLEDHLRPDIILIDTCPGIGDVTSSCVMDLGASLVLLFAGGDDATRAGYRILFDHWHKTGVAQKIRQRLQPVVAASAESNIEILPYSRVSRYFSGLCGPGCDIFAVSPYDAAPPAVLFDLEKTGVTPARSHWPVRWGRELHALNTSYIRLSETDRALVYHCFEVFVDRYSTALYRRDLCIQADNNGA